MMKPCPFCGSSEVMGIPVGKEKARIVCKCLAGGPLVDEGGQAEAWNTRAEPTSEQIKERINGMYWIGSCGEAGERVTVDDIRYVIAAQEREDG